MTLWEFLRRRWGTLAVLGACAGIFAVVLSLYQMEAEAVGYASLLCIVVLLVWGGATYARWKEKGNVLEGLRGRAALALEELPDSQDALETLYQELLRELNAERRTAASESDARRREAIEYFTLWVHQIKTPIAAMRLMLEDTARDREMASELFRVERYAEMALSYLRLDGPSNDYVIHECALSRILHQAARKYAPLFIRGQVALDLEETTLRVLTDEKWLQIVVEQLLSNAVKYAPGGHVRVYTVGETLCIEDDGAGIAPEDLPRIFEWGYTGWNGRMDKRATGIGLYLCRKICDCLGHTIAVSSDLGQGTTVEVNLSRAGLEVE